MMMSLGVLLGTICFLSAANAAGIKEGEWDMAMTIQMAGSAGDELAKAQKEMDSMPAEQKAMMQQMMGNMGMKMGGATPGGMTINKKQCMTNDHPVPQQKDQENCKETHTVNGNTVNFEITCKDSHSIGEVTYNDDSMKGNIKSTNTRGGRKEEVAIDLSGQYLGPCKS